MKTQMYKAEIVIKFYWAQLKFYLVQLKSQWVALRYWFVLLLRSAEPSVLTGVPFVTLGEPSLLVNFEFQR